MSETPPAAPDESARDDRFAFLFGTGETPRLAVGEPDGGPLHRLLAFLTAVACSHLTHERVIDEPTAQAFRRALREPSLSSSVRLLHALVSGRKVRAAELLGIVPAESSRGLAVTTELLDLLVSLRRELEEQAREDPEGALARPDASAGELLAQFLRSHFNGELVLVEPGAGPSTLAAAARPGPVPESGPAAYLARSDGSRQPLHPFVVGSRKGGGDRHQVLWSFDAGVLRYRRLDAAGATEADVGLHDDFFLEFLLKMGAYGEVREWLKGMEPDSRASLNRRNILYAGFCHYGSLYLRQREFQQALVELEKAVKIRPDLVLAHLYLAQAAMNLKQFDRAVDILKRHAVLFNRSDRIFELIGDCYRQKKDSVTALRMYEKAAGLNPFNVQVEKKRGLLRDEQLAARESARGQGGPQAAVKLDELLVDMTLEAELGMYTETVRREEEIRQLIEILACRDKRNALLLGEPGVGKTAIVEDFVLRLAQGRVPERFRDKKVYLMSVATLLAGAKYRGQFEERVLELVKELKSRDCILFVDNIHNIVNAGLTRGGTLDTSSILKPYLMRGEIQVIGATTHEEFRSNLEKDASLMRCFQPVQVEEPSLEAAADMVCHVRQRYESHHRVVLPETVVRSVLPVIDACVRDRALPDVAIDVLDRASAVASLRRGAGPPENGFVELGSDDVLEVLAEMTRIPIARLSEVARERFARLETFLEARVIGQEDAVGRVSRVLRAARTGLILDDRRPKGVFLFVGPTGVGKTELAKAMAELLFGSDERLIRIDMSEYMERINQSRLIGTAPGYVGYNDQNQLTDEVRKNPHSLVLLDEIEKADTNMLNLFLQVFDAGRLTDGKGRTVHFDNTTVVMTSNVGTELFSRTAVGYEDDRGGRRGASASDLLRQVRRTFTPEFLNRIDEVICFDPLSTDEVRLIARQKLATLTSRLAAQGKCLEVSAAAEEIVAREGHSYEQGARNLERTIRRLILEPLAERALEDDWEEASLVRVAGEGDRLRFELCPAEDAAEVVEESSVPLEEDRRES